LTSARPHQREFVCKDAQRAAVIRSVLQGYPLNAMHWAQRPGKLFEIVDGQQRTISIGQYVTGDYSLDGKCFHSLQADERDTLLDCKLTIFVCSGTDSEKLAWDETINIAGELLTHQELRNAAYTGPWLADARRHFSKPGGPAAGLGKDHLAGAPLRQEYLETALAWISARGGLSIEACMSAHQHDPTAGELWRYFQAVLSGVQSVFPTVRPSMKGVEWGPLHDAHHTRRTLDPVALAADGVRLHADDDVTRNKGIHAYLLTGAEKHLNIRRFTPAMREAAYARQKGVCPICGNKFAIEDMDADPITPWSKGGTAPPENCQRVSRECNRRKGRSRRHTNTPPLPLGENKTLMDTLADLDCIDGRVEELELDAPPDPSAVANARALIEKIHDIYPARYHVSPTKRRGVAIEAPVKKGAAVSLECAPNDIVYCFVAINGKRRRAKFYQMTDLPDPFIKTALQDLAKG